MHKYDQPIGAPQTKSMGNQGKGAYGAVGFTWADVDVPDELPATTVKLCYQIMNLGNLKPADAQKAMTEIMAREEHESDETDSWVVLLLKWLSVKGIEALLADCDGPIGPREGRIVVWHSFELLAAPQGVTSEETVHEHGNNSPTGCGATRVTMCISRPCVISHLPCEVAFTRFQSRGLLGLESAAPPP
jgi:hypothetical protein